MEVESQNTEFLSILRAEQSDYTTTGTITEILVHDIDNPFVKPTFYIGLQPTHRAGTIYCKLFGVTDLVELIVQIAETDTSVTELLNTTLTFTLTDNYIHINGGEYHTASKLPSETVNLCTELTEKDKDALKKKILQSRLDMTTGVLTVNEVNPNTSELHLTLLTTEQDFAVSLDLPKSYDSSHESVVMIDTLSGGTIENLDGMSVQISTTETDKENEVCIDTEIGELYISDIHSPSSNAQPDETSLYSRIKRYFE